MKPCEQYSVYQSRDGLWRAKFEPKIAAAIGPAAAFIIQAQSEATANTLAGILVSDALTRITPWRKKKCGK